jgi:hypothetical protein
MAKEVAAFLRAETVVLRPRDESAQKTVDSRVNFRLSMTHLQFHQNT